MIYNENYYTRLFSTGVPEMEKIIDEALANGGDYADLYFENTQVGNLQLRDGSVTAGSFQMDYGVGIRTMKGEKTGYAFSQDTSMSPMLEAAKAASAIALSPIEIEPKRTRPFPGKPNPAADRYPFASGWNSEGTASFVPYMHKLEAAIRAKDSRVLKVIGMLAWQMSDIMMFNSAGELKYDTRPMGTLAASIIFNDGQTIQNSHVSRSFRMGPEFMTDDLINELATMAVRNLDDKFKARRPKGGKMPVVMGAGASGILLHEAMGHAFEADFNRKNQSIFSDKMGKRICAEGINIVDDGTIVGNRGSLNYDDEGVPAQKTYMVTDGILTSYLHDRISAKFYDVAPTGNGRRESFRYKSHSSYEGDLYGGWQMLIRRA